MINLPLAQKIVIAGAVALLWAGLLLRSAVPAPNGILLESSPFFNAGGWVEMPAGARPAYMGINGGTVPVSLLAAGDGHAMITFVGRTGNDFLRMLHNTSISFPTATAASGEDQASVPAANATVLMADTAIGNVPVFYCTGKEFARMGLDEEWLPFGLSEKPLLLEGQVARNAQMTGQVKPRKYRRALWQRRLQRPFLSTR